MNEVVTQIGTGVLIGILIMGVFTLLLIKILGRK